VKVGTLTITDLWTRATPPGAPAAGGFLTITNTGTEPDRLIAVSSPETAAGELHEMSMENDVMKMNAVAGGIEIPAGATVKLAPGGLHLMLIGPKGPLTEGGKFPVTLTFEKAGKIDTFLHIMPIGSKGPDGTGGGHDHGAMQ
jgi:copper(I)-binding protein